MFYPGIAFITIPSLAMNLTIEDEQDILHKCKIRPHPPTPSPKIGRRGVNFKVPLPSLGEGFRVRAFDSCKKSNVLKRRGTQSNAEIFLNLFRYELIKYCTETLMRNYRNTISISDE
ncbi:hypothetical protein CDG76_07200 [Nostoc sp. 'Peltigera membranacea cyanobiont' 210A]|nr:hypothetical protein CDG76_07200 [Nostoc sp. 'Peltigera membranacea cyanobiont' 210A]